MHRMLLFWFVDFGGSLEPNPNHNQEMQILEYYNYLSPLVKMQLEMGMWLFEIFLKLLLQCSILGLSLGLRCSMRDQCFGP